MPDFNFIGASYVAPSIYQDDQELINAYPEIASSKSEGERGIIALYPTPGLVTQLVFPNAGPVRGLYTPSGAALLFAVSNNQVFTVSPAYSVTAIGTLTTSAGLVSITDNGTSVYFTDGPNRYYCALNGTGFTQLAAGDGAFTGADMCDVVDTFIIYNNPGTQQWGATNSASTTSSALSAANKSAAPDNLVALICDHRDVHLKGEKTSEVWIDVGTFPFPFQIVPGTMLQHGIVAKWSLARLGESHAYLSQDTRGRAIVVMMKGYQPQRISTHAIENAIAGYVAAGKIITDAQAFTYQQGGHEFYMLTFPTADVTWCYDLATQLWHKRAWRDSANVYHRHRANCHAVFNGLNFVGDYQNANLYQLSQQVYTDAGAALPIVRRAPHLTQDLRRVFYHDLQIQFQPGVGLATGQGSNPQAMLHWSDDGGSTFGNEHWTTIGTLGAYKNRAIWRRLGAARDRIFEVVITDPVYRVMVSAELNASPAEH